MAATTATMSDVQIASSEDPVGGAGMVTMAGSAAAGSGGAPDPMDTTEDGSTYSVAELAQIIDNLKHIEPEVRLQSVRELTVVAAALGPDRTRAELLPYLLETIDDEDEVLLALAEELEKLVPLVGGAEHAHSLLPLFEALVQVEEAAVRTQAVAALNTVASHMPTAHVIEYVVPLADHLTAAHWYTTRTSACSVLPELYTLLKGASQRQVILTWFQSLCHDPTPMVRRAAATSLVTLVDRLEPQLKASYVMPLFEQFAKDEQDSVRLLAVNTVAPMAAAASESAAAAGGDSARTLTVLLEAYRVLANDPSWRVRYMVADTIAKVQTSVHPGLATSTLLPIFVSLLGDGEPEVRSAIAVKVLEFCTNLPAEKRSQSMVTTVMPLLARMVSDDSQHVRASLASVIMGLAAVLGKDATVEHLLPLLLQLLRDEFSEVRLNIISHLDAVNQVIGVDQLSQSLLPAIEELATHSSWRVRLAIIEFIPLVSRQLGQQLYNEKLLPMCLTWLRDPIAAVREAGAKNFQDIVAGFGTQWARTILLPSILDMAHDSSFVCRMTALLTLTLLMSACDKETVALFVVPCVCALRQDKIPNIKLNVARALQKAAPLVDRTIQDTQVRPALDALVQDQDPDVRYFATKALKDVHQLAESTA
eukprot:m.104240 g.104240  ORF g.104240 m.104240 type:complete len:649 (+) comp15635_c0_seq1:512-2458(+)